MKIEITVPSYPRRVDPAAHFTVGGIIEGAERLDEDTLIEIRLSDADGNMLRRVSARRGDSARIFAYHPEITAYDETFDPGRIKMTDFGFPEAAVRDKAEPYASMRDASIKCILKDDSFKAMIVGGTDRAHGMLLDDGIGFTGERGEPYDALGEGIYTIEAVLSLNGKRLASDCRTMTVAPADRTLICRFNPVRHRANMKKWAETEGFAMQNDPLPGYLDPYLGKWYYHMGFLPMYRASDVAQYAHSEVNMFVYLIDPHSTSYETELAFLQSRGAVGSARFRAWRYDIGEAIVCPGKPYGRSGVICEFGKGEYLCLCRADCVDGGARENEYDISGAHVTDVSYADEGICVHAGTRAALMCTLRPMQGEPEKFVPKKDNTYDIGWSVDTLRYEIKTRRGTYTCMRSVGLERYDGGEYICSSVFEAYNIFDVPEDMRGTQARIAVTAVDSFGRDTQACAEAVIRVI